MALVPLPGDLPGNSQSQKAPKVEERPKVEKLITTTALERKKSVGRRFADVFTGEDAKSVGTYVLMDVLIPSVRNMVSDALTTGIERFFYGDGRARRSTGGSSYGPYSQPHVAYNRASQASAPPWQTPAPVREMTKRGRATHDFREIVINNRQEAEVILDALTELVSKYGVATVADLYDAAGWSSEFTDRKWGWTDLRDASILRIREGYLIQLPPPGPIS